MSSVVHDGISASTEAAPWPQCGFHGRSEIGLTLRPASSTDEASLPVCVPLTLSSCHCISAMSTSARWVCRGQQTYRDHGPARQRRVSCRQPWPWLAATQLPTAVPTFGKCHCRGCYCSGVQQASATCSPGTALARELAASSRAPPVHR